MENEYDDYDYDEYITSTKEEEMNMKGFTFITNHIYQLKFDYYEDQLDDKNEQPVLLLHEKKYTQKAFQDIIGSINFQMGRHKSYNELIKRLEYFGFHEVVTGYFNE